MAEIKLQKRAVYATDVYAALVKAGYEDAEYFIQRLPSADIAPVRHGHWIDCEDEYSSYVRCSECGDEFTCWEADCAHTDFCPGCGADMRGADNG